MKIKRVTADPLVSPLPRRSRSRRGGWPPLRDDRRDRDRRRQRGGGGLSRRASSRRRSPPPWSSTRSRRRRGRGRLRHRGAVAPDVPRHARLPPQGHGIAAISAVAWRCGICRQGVRPVRAPPFGRGLPEEMRAYADGFYRRTARARPRASCRRRSSRRRWLLRGQGEVGFGVADDIVVLREIAAALRGSGVATMIDANHAYGVADAVALAAAGRSGSLWFEEPVVPEDRDGYAEVRRAPTMPIAGGESSTRSTAFAIFWRRAASTSCSPTSRPAAASRRRSTSSRWRRRTACASTRTSGAPASRRRRR